MSGVFKNLLGWNKKPACGNLKDLGYNSEFSVSYSEGLLKKWENISAAPGENMKKVVVVVDDSKESKVALQWSLIHVANPSHRLILLHISISRNNGLSSKNDDNSERNNNKEKALAFTKSLEAFCKSLRPDVEVESVVSEGGDKTNTVVRCAKQLEASVLVLGQKRQSMFGRVFQGMKEDIAEFCIANTDCFTVGVRKRSSKYGGYMINSKEVKNFWLLA